MNTFDNALEIIRKDGWCQFSLKNFKGEHCIQGALYEAKCGPDSWRWSSKDIVEETLMLAEIIHFHYGYEISSDNYSPPGWQTNVLFNNDVDRSQKTIERVLQIASDIWEERNNERH